MYQTQEKPCSECKWCRPEKFVFFDGYEMARCAYPVSLATHSGRFSTAVGAPRFCYWERHPLGFCRKDAIFWERKADYRLEPAMSGMMRASAPVRVAA